MIRAACLEVIELAAAMKQAARGIRRGFDDGSTFLRVGSQLIDGGATPHQAAVEIVGAVDAYCPRNDRSLSFNGHQMRWLPV